MLNNKNMNKIKIATVPKPLEWKRGVKKHYEDSIDVLRALNTQLGPDTYQYYQIEIQRKNGISYLSIVIRQGDDEEQFQEIANSRNTQELMELAEKYRLRCIGGFVCWQVSQTEILEDMIPPLNWKDVELPTMSGLKSCIYAKILSLSKDGEMYFLISQGATERYYLEIKCSLDSEDEVKEVIYTDNDLEEVKDFARRYRLYQIAKSLTGG